MLQSLMMFLAPAAAQRQATSGPAPVAAEPLRAQLARLAISCRRVFTVMLDAAGFVTLFAACWLTLLLMQALLPS